MGRQWRWRGVLVAGAIALTAAQSVQADPVRAPLPALPQVSVPALPQVSVPALPQVSVPALPRVSTPALPQVSTPALPSLPLPAPPAVEAPERAPAPTSVTPRQHTAANSAIAEPADTACARPGCGAGRSASGHRTSAARALLRSACGGCWSRSPPASPRSDPCRSG